MPMKSWRNKCAADLESTAFWESGALEALEPEEKWMCSWRIRRLKHTLSGGRWGKTPPQTISTNHMSTFPHWWMVFRSSRVNTGCRSAVVYLCHIHVYPTSAVSVLLLPHIETRPAHLIVGVISVEKKTCDIWPNKTLTLPELCSHLDSCRGIQGSPSNSGCTWKKVKSPAAVNWSVDVPVISRAESHWGGGYDIPPVGKEHRAKTKSYEQKLGQSSAWTSPPTHPPPLTRSPAHAPHRESWTKYKLVKGGFCNSEHDVRQQNRPTTWQESAAVTEWMFSFDSFPVFYLPALNHLHRRGREQSVGQQVNFLHDVWKSDRKLLSQKDEGRLLTGVYGTYRTQSK